MSESIYSPITSEVDFNQFGKQAGYLHLPHSVHRSAYGRIPIPVISIKNGNGPKTLLMAGNHGDEYEGQIALAELGRNLTTDEVQGHLLILPMANLPAAKAGLRTSPIDDGNLNRSFPGNPHGTVTEIIAHYIESILLPGCDYLLDLHSGGSSLIYQPTLMTPYPDSSSQREKVIPMLQALGFPNALFYPIDDSGRFSCSAAARNNAIAITVEAAGAGTVTPAALNFLRDGLQRYLSVIGVLEARSDLPEPPPFRLLEIKDPQYYAYADCEGLFEPSVELGESVNPGDRAGWIHDPFHPMNQPVEVLFERSGIVVCKRQPAPVQHGDCLLHLASAIDE